MTRLTVAPRDVNRTFMNFPFVEDLDTLKADITIIGMPYGSPYSIDEMTNDQTNGPTAMRRASRNISVDLDRYDFDIGGTLFDGQDIKVVDVGDVPGEAADIGGHYRRSEAAIRKILAAGAMPIILGGDHGIPIPVLRALDGEGPITVIQIDAHLDWLDERNGVKDGYSSNMRRASEMAHVDRIFQLGIRGQGSARFEEIEAARAYGVDIVTAAQWEKEGTDAILARIPDGGRYYLTLDADGLDPAVMPAVAAPSPGGISYRQTIDLIKGVIGKGRLVGMDMVEITPSRDINEISSITAGNIILNAIGAAVRAGYFKR
ncbi:agmatinase [Pseudaminobacter salicylatoxidans]|uniref:Agmatinase n=1 Tax=Pseudaminobacter salicylatoxidans TaxID=93369 RepID=A0A316CAC3_PSESE|nr:agmatinase [Pseudaminobacter salicylatoxidans]PWJ86448.1 agmatinase [Pseudaminobacter salicylatoxidans]